MEELNQTQSVVLSEETGFDTLSIINLGETISLSQVDEDRDLHNLILGPEQAAVLMAQLVIFLG